METLFVYIICSTVAMLMSIVVSELISAIRGFANPAHLVAGLIVGGIPTFYGLFIYLTVTS